MPRNRLVVATLCWIAFAVPGHTLSADQDLLSEQGGEGPKSVVNQWLDLHRQGKRKLADALTTGTPFHQADHQLPANQKMKLHVAHCLGNEHAAAVITSALPKAGQPESIVLFWLVQRDDEWQINKSAILRRDVAAERLRGFLEAGDVRWHVDRNDLVGHWQAGPGAPPTSDQVACGSSFKIHASGEFQLTEWGPAGPSEEFDPTTRGTWQLSSGGISLLDKTRKHERRIAWMENDRFILETLDGKHRTMYERQAETAE